MICKYFNLPDDTFDDFLSSKQMTLLKIITHSNDIVKVYCAQDVAIVFDFKGKLYPSLFMAWKFPHIVPRLKIDEMYKSNIICSPELTIKNITSGNNDQQLCSLLVDQCVSICINSCQKILAIGYLIMDGKTIISCERNNDKCLKLLHYHKDELFKMHISTIIPDTILAMEREFKNAPESNNDITNQVEDARTVIEKTDELLLTCSLKALKNSVTKEMLPILASTFYKKYVMSFCPEGIELDIKKTSFKKLSTFLQLLDEEGIIKFVVGKNGIAEISHINYNNTKFQEMNLEDDTQLKENVDQYSPPVKEIYVVTPGLQPIFSEFLCKFVNFLNLLYTLLHNQQNIITIILVIIGT